MLLSLCLYCFPHVHHLSLFVITKLCRVVGLSLESFKVFLFLMVIEMDMFFLTPSLYKLLTSLLCCLSYYCFFFCLVLIVDIITIINFSFFCSKQKRPTLKELLKVHTF